MNKPTLSNHIKDRLPSAIRLAQIEFNNREDKIGVVNTAIGNVSLPMHPAMQERMLHLNAEQSPFKDGVVKYTTTKGLNECNHAFLHVIESSGFKTNKLYSQITDGGSQAMELMIVAVCGDAGTDKAPLLLIDAAYTNYTSLAKRLGRKTVSVQRQLNDNGKFSFPNMSEIEETIKKEKPGAMVVIPYDNPTGQFIDQQTMTEFAKLAIKYNMWMISDEAYRELYYTEDKPSSIWALDEDQLPGITGRRVSIETSSKVWNACGLRIGALVTDNRELNIKCVNENTASLCSNAIGQYIFSALGKVSVNELKDWYQKQRAYYFGMLKKLSTDLKALLPGIIVSSPDASIYSVVDVRKIAKPGFDAGEFVMYMATKGCVSLDGETYTLLVSPMAGFYNTEENNPGLTQMRIAYVEAPHKMELVPKLFAALFKEFEAKR
ncbi:MAG: aminotransferase class I/II [Acidobacteria bacterium]|nr:MAG: aminotransferase class I/II [Acidobacteriota bacterium]PIE90948.1 MAG: aminotransferase class I/II [Acidobacteriota bacterium]